MLLRHEGFRRLCRARELLRDERQASRPLADLARELGVSPYHFIRQFESVFGVTPHQCRIDVRLEHAKRLLVTGRYSVTDVCFAVGFSSLGSFSTMFADRVGEPPSSYRRRVRAMIQVPAMWHQVVAPGCLTLLAHLPASAFGTHRNFREASIGADPSH